MQTAVIAASSFVRPPYGTSMTYQYSNSLNERFIIVLARLSTNLLYTLLILTAFSYGVNSNKLSPYRHLQQVQYHRPLSSLSTQTCTTYKIRELNVRGKSYWLARRLPRNLSFQIPRRFHVSIDTQLICLWKSSIFSNHLFENLTSSILHYGRREFPSVESEVCVRYKVSTQRQLCLVPTDGSSSCSLAFLLLSSILCLYWQPFPGLR